MIYDEMSWDNQAEWHVVNLIKLLNGVEDHIIWVLSFVVLLLREDFLKLEPQLVH